MSICLNIIGCNIFDKLRCSSHAKEVKRADSYAAGSTSNFFLFYRGKILAPSFITLSLDLN
jgi:hypothetical protein